MKKIIFLSVLIAFAFGGCTKHECNTKQQSDWLVNDKQYISEVITSGNEVSISNGLIERKFRISPNFATIGMKNLVTGQAYMRSVRPETQIVIDGQKFDVGGLTGQPIHSYLLTEWIDKLENDKESFQYVKYTIQDIQPRFGWKIREEWISRDVKWPAAGKELIVEFKAPDSAQQLKALTVKVHYEIYDGIPLICKWFSLQNNSTQKVVLDSFVSEILAAVEGESSVEGELDWELPNIHIETDYAFSAMGSHKASSSVVKWVVDPSYYSQVNSSSKTPCLLKVGPAIGPAQKVETGGSFESFHTWELFYDSYDKERKGLSERKMYRTIAPWIAENPILMHVSRADSASVKKAVDQCAEVGFEMVIMTFGSGFNMESGDISYYKEIKKMADYAHSKGIALGGYSLLASRSVGPKNDIVNPATGKTGGFAYFGNSPCIESEWGIEYFRKIKELYEYTGLDIIEHDGSYPGDFCASTEHPGHDGYEDSQWNQFKTISNFYRWCRSQGIYLNVPDWYYLNGSTKCGMGYREGNWSLARAYQEIIERQNIFDGTWRKTASMGWMFVPLTQYHGGGAAATIEPLNEHLDHYNQRLANLFGAGVQACYRGPRLYDTDSTKAVVQNWVNFYKKHRQVLDSDIIHLRRPDGVDWDGILHVNPTGEEKGLLMLHNPTEKPINRKLEIPAYYTGLGNKASIEDMNGKSKTYQIDRDYIIHLDVAIPARGYYYYILR